MEEASGAADDSQDPKNCCWVKALSIWSPSPSPGAAAAPLLPGVMAWSKANLIAVVTEDAVRVVDAAVALEQTQEPKIVARVPRPQAPDVAPANKVTPFRGTSKWRPSPYERGLQRLLRVQRLPCISSLAWSPPGCGPYGGELLVIADTRGDVSVHSMPDVGSYDLLAPVIWNLSSELFKAGAAQVGLNVPRIHPDPVFIPTCTDSLHQSICSGEILFSDAAYLAFSPSTLPVQGTMRQSQQALLFVAQGSVVCMWRMCHATLACRCLAGFAVNPKCEEGGDDNVRVARATAVAVSSMRAVVAANGQNQARLVLAVGTSFGTVQVWDLRLVSTPESGWTVAVGAPVVRLFADAHAAVGSLAIASELHGFRRPSDEQKAPHLIAAAHGADVSASMVCLPTNESVEASWSIMRFKASAPGHGWPVHSLIVDPSGAVAGFDAPSRFGTRLRILSFDSTGHMATWTLGEPMLEDVSLLALCSAKYTGPHLPEHFLTPTEQAATVVEARVLRSAAKDGAEPINKLFFTGAAASPSGCLLALQATGRSERTTQQRATNFVFIAPLVPPAQVFLALLWSLCGAVAGAFVSAPLVLPAWDLCQSWTMLMRKQKLATSASFLERAAAPILSARDSNAAPSLHDILAWLWFSVRAIGGEAESSSVRDAEFPCGEVQQSLSRWLDERVARLRVGGASGGLQECQLRNSLLELGLQLKTVDGQQSWEFHSRRRTPATSGLDLDATSARARALAASEYWRCCRMPRPPGVDAEPLAGKPALLAHVASAVSALAEGGGDTPGCRPHQAQGRLQAKCRLCSGPAAADWGLLTVTCERGHEAPLCQWSLTPLLLERHLACQLCGRATVCCPPGIEGSVPAAGVCAWCASPVPASSSA